MQVISLAPEDLAALTAQLLAGLRLQLAGTVRADLESLLHEQEQRLLAALLPERRPGRVGSGSTISATPSTPTRRLNPKNFCSAPGESPSPKGDSSALKRRFSAPALKFDDTDSFPQIRRLSAPAIPVLPSPAVDRRGPSWISYNPEKRWLPWRHLGVDFARTSRSGLKSLGDARDSELLAAVQDVGETRCEQLSSRRSSPCTTTSGSFKFGEMAGLSGICRAASFSQNRSMEDSLPDKARRPEEQATVIPVAGAAAEGRLRGAFTKRGTRQALSLPPIQHPWAERGSAAHEAAAASTARASVGQDDLNMAHRPGEIFNLAAMATAGRLSRRRKSPAMSLLPMQITEEESSSVKDVKLAALVATSAHKEPASAAATPDLEGSFTPSTPRRWSFSPSILHSSSSAPVASFREPTMQIFRRNSTSGTQMLRKKREEELLGEFASVTVPSAAEESPADPGSGRESRAAAPGAHLVRRMSSPLLLRFCGILPWGRLGEAYQGGMLLAAAGLVAIFAMQLYRAQSQIASPSDCPAGICMHFAYLGDLVLAAGGVLGLLAMRTLTSMKLLGSPGALLSRYAMEHDVVWTWFCASSWQSFYLAILWAGSLAFRGIAIASGPGLKAAIIQGTMFVPTTLIFMGLVFTILHVSCLICILIDSYAMSVQETMDLAEGIQEWDQLGALIRKVSRGLDRSFLLVQTTAVVLLLCSFGDLMLQGVQQIWRFISDMLLAQSLVLIFFKAAEVTEMCTRVPSIINSLDFNGDSFSMEKHYLVEHITYSDAGFYVGEVRLTAAMALKLMYVSILGAFGVLTKLTTLNTS